MSLYQLNKFLRDLSRSSDFVNRCQKSLGSVLDGYELTTQEKRALEDWQVRQLYDMGVNPLLLLTSSMAMGKDMRSYVAELRTKSQ
jgi:hypothetical protein